MIATCDTQFRQENNSSVEFTSLAFVLLTFMAASFYSNHMQQLGWKQTKH